MNGYVDSQIADPRRRESFKKSFRAEKLTDDEFRWFFTDTIVLEVQSGRRKELCEGFKMKTIAEMVEQVRQVSLKSDDYKQYGSYYLRDTTVDYNTQHR